MLFRSAGRLPRLAYDLSLYEPSERVADVMNFYEHVVESRQESRVKPWVRVAVAT